MITGVHIKHDETLFPFQHKVFKKRAEYAKITQVRTSGDYREPLRSAQTASLKAELSNSLSELD